MNDLMKRLVLGGIALAATAAPATAVQVYTSRAAFNAATSEGWRLVGGTETFDVDRALSVGANSFSNFNLLIEGAVGNNGASGGVLRVEESAASNIDFSFPRTGVIIGFGMDVTSANSSGGITLMIAGRPGTASTTLLAPPGDGFFGILFSSGGGEFRNVVLSANTGTESFTIDNLTVAANLPEPTTLLIAALPAWACQRRRRIF